MRIKDKLSSGLEAWTRQVQRFALLIVLFFVGLSGAGAWYTAGNLGINTDLSDMISHELGFHQRWVEYKTEFPYLTDTLVFVLEGKDVEGLNRSAEAFESDLKTQPEYFEKIYYAPAQDEAKLYFEVRPKMDYSQILPAENAILKAREILAGESYKDLEFRITGTAALGYEELQSVSKGAWISGLLSLALVAVLLFLALRSFQLMGLTLLNLILGLLLTASFAAIAVGHLNMVSVAFAVLFIGLGIDFSIHLCLRFREKLQSGLKKTEAIPAATKEIGTSLLLCTLTTSAGFLAFVPTAYKGVSELGIISGAGMLINLIVHMSLLPALLHLMPIREKGRDFEASSLWIRFFTGPVRHPKWAMRICVLLVGFSLAGAPFIKFDANPLNLQDPTTEAYQTYQDLLEDPKLSPWTAKLIVSSRDEIGALSQKLEKLPEVSRVESLLTFEQQTQQAMREFPRRMPKAQQEAFQAKLENYRTRYVSENNKYRLEIFPAERINTVPAMREFSKAVLSVAPGATDDPVTIPLTGDAIVEAFMQAGIMAVLIIFFLLWVICRSLRDVALILTPIFVGGVVTVGIMEAFSIPFNFANIIVLPLLLGIGVDSGIHLVHQYRQLGDLREIFKSTCRGVFFSALTTIASFGTLILSDHRGTSSMGLVLTIGTALMMISTLTVLPAVLSLMRKPEELRGRTPRKQAAAG